MLGRSPYGAIINSHGSASAEEHTAKEAKRPLIMRDKMDLMSIPLFVLGLPADDYHNFHLRSRRKRLKEGAGMGYPSPAFTLFRR
jgi:hypothetical protein